MTDPLSGLISRSLRVEVTDVTAEPIRRDAHLELERVHFRVEGAPRTLVIKRVPRERSLEVQLLPFLGRRSPLVPRVEARGIPPPAVPARPWLLLEDTLDLPGACDSDPGAIVAAKLELERAVAADTPALRALGVPELRPEDIAALAREGGAPAEVIADADAAAARLAGWPMALVHGDLTCANASRDDGGRVVLAEWRWAHLGCALLDVVRLTGDLVARGDAVRGIGLSRVYDALAGRTIGTDKLRAAELLERLVARYRRD